MDGENIFVRCVPRSPPELPNFLPLIIQFVYFKPAHRLSALHLSLSRLFPRFDFFAPRASLLPLFFLLPFLHPVRLLGNRSSS